MSKKKEDEEIIEEAVETAEAVEESEAEEIAETESADAEDASEAESTDESQEEETAEAADDQTEESSEASEELNEASEELVELEPEAIQSAIESILFAMGESVEIDKIADVIGTTKGNVEDALDMLSEKYENPACGVQLVRLENSVQLCTKPDNYEYLIKVTKTKPKFTLSDTVLETLSIIAYKQPVTKIEIEKIRGVSCDHAVNKLLEYDLIKEFGRLDAPGKPILFGTTENFLRCFGVTSISDLPQITPEQVEEYKKEAESEISVKLDI